MSSHGWPSSLCTPRICVWLLENLLCSLAAMLIAWRSPIKYIRQSTSPMLPPAVPLAFMCSLTMIGRPFNIDG